MSRMPDIEHEVRTLLAGHATEEDRLSPRMGVLTCPHFGPWVDAIAAVPDNVDGLASFVVLGGSEPSDTIGAAIAALGLSHLPTGWIEILRWAGRNQAPIDFVASAVGALYGVIEQRLSGEAISFPVDAQALAYLVEGTMAFETEFIEADNHNYVPMGQPESWWPAYLSIIDASCSASDLRKVSAVFGGICVTETLSTRTPTERLRDIYYTRGWSTTASANANLPTDLVNQEMENNWNLLFHPKAELDRSWRIIEAALESHEFEELGFVMLEFQNMRDGNWFELSGFATRSPQAVWLMERMRQWVFANVEDEDEVEEALELLGIDSEAM